MTLSLSSLGCGELDLRTHGSPPTVVTLKSILDGAGILEFDEGITRIGNLAIRELLAAIEFPLAGGRLFSEQPATISHVTCEGRIRNGFAGQLRAGVAHSESICLELEKVKAKADMMAEELLIKLDGRGGRIEVGTLTLKDSQITVGGLLIRLGALSVRGLKVAWDEGRPRTSALKAHAKDLHIQVGGATIDIAAIDLPEGLRVHNEIDIAQVLVGAIEIAVDELVKKAAEATEEAEEPEASPLSEMPIALPKIELDHNIFDTMNGDLSVDATLAVTLPVIGKRVATHSFRIPVAGGIIDYRDFERGLSDLEDAFLDIRVRGSRLVLERDIPLIPGLQKPIVTWDLSAGELELAKQHLVRIATLPKFALVGSDSEEEEGKKSKLRLHRLDFDGIAVHLSLDETAVLKSGEGSLRAHVDDLDLAGSIHFDPDEEDKVSMTALAAKAKGLGLVASKLSVGLNELSGVLDIGSMERFQLGMDELRPTNLNIALKNFALSGLHLRLGKR